MAHKRSDTLPTGDVALGRQVGQRPAHRDPRNPELLTQLLLGGKRLARGDRSTRDLVVQHQEQLPVQRHAGSRSHQHGRAAGLVRGHRVPPAPFKALQYHQLSYYYNNHMT